MALSSIGALHAVLDDENVCSIATDENGVIQLFTRGAERLLGYASSDVRGKLTLSHIAQPRAVYARARSLSLGTTMAAFLTATLKAANGIQDRSELILFGNHGRRVRALVSVIVLLDDQDRLVGHCLIGTEESPRPSAPPPWTRARIEENLGALITIDANGLITDANPQMESLTACPREELLGGPFKNWFTEPERAEAGIEVALRQQLVSECELTSRGTDGHEEPVSLRASPFQDRGQRPQGVGAVARLRGVFGMGRGGLEAASPGVLKAQNVPFRRVRRAVKALRGP